MTDKQRIKELEEEIQRRNKAEENRKVQSYKDELRELSELASWNNGGTSESRLSHIAHFFLLRSEAAEQERDKLLQALKDIVAVPVAKSMYNEALVLHNIAHKALEGSQPDGRE